MEIALILLGCYFSLFFLSIKLRDNSIVDIFWGLGFLVISTLLYIQNSFGELFASFILGLILIWSSRLSYHIFQRKLKEKKEDPRYAKWRKSWKYFYLRSLFQVYLLQMVLLMIVATPLYFIFSGEEINSLFVFIGGIIAIIGLCIEIIADIQVQEYIKKNGKNNRVYTKGLYKYSRNPNYFGESLFWLGLSIIGAGESIYSFIGFFLITFLLLFISGVPLKEKRQETKENWKEYKARTSIFFPWFRKK